MTDRTYEAESLHTHESIERDARLVGHEPKGSKMTERVDPETVTQLCHKVINYVAHGKAMWDADFGSIIDTLRALEAERDALEAKNQRLREVVDCGTLADTLIEMNADQCRLTMTNRGWPDGLSVPLNDDDESRHQVAELSLEDSGYGPMLWDYAISVIKARAALAEQEKTDEQ